MTKPRPMIGSKNIRVPLQCFDVYNSIYEKLIQLNEKTYKGDIILLALQHYEKSIDRRLKNGRDESND